jgi:large conductance mechanosensitive channel
MFSGYIEFLTNFNVIGLAIGFIIGANLKDIANAIISDLIMPFINPLLEKMAGDKGFVFEMPGGIKFNLDKIVEASIKFIALSILIFALMSYGVNIKKPTKWVEVRNFDKLVGALKKVK